MQNLLQKLILCYKSCLKKFGSLRAAEGGGVLKKRNASGRGGASYVGHRKNESCWRGLGEKLRGRAS